MIDGQFAAAIADREISRIGCGCAVVFLVGLVIGLAVGCGLVAEIWSYM